MNEQNIFERLKKSQPEIKNKNYIKNNIIAVKKNEKKSIFIERLLLVLGFILTVILIKDNIVLEFYPGQDIYNTVRVNMFIPLFIVSAVISIFVSVLTMFFYKITR